jgi:hypothetical protein
MTCQSKLGWYGPLLLLLPLLGGCEEPAQSPARNKPLPKKQPASEEPPAGKKVKVADNIELEILPTRRRVWVDAVVCLREGPLEQLLTRKNTKEHEAILAADIDARKLHEALLLANAREGSPVRWVPQYRPPTGTPIKISLLYEQKDRVVRVPAASWIRQIKTKKELPCDWVFAGSVFLDPIEPGGPRTYLANDGDVICIANFESALLDIPIESSKADGERGYEAWTERIPPIGTVVRVLLEPMSTEKKDP